MSISDKSCLVQDTAETILTKLEENLSIGSKYEQGSQLGELKPLSEESKDVEEVLNMISHSIYKEGEGHLLLKLCDRSSLLSIVSHSLSAYITTLDPQPLRRISGQIASEVAIWMCKLFKFDQGGSAFCHDDMREGLVKITRMAMFKQYPKMLESGFQALQSRSPMIYLTSNTYLDMANYICLQLGLPQTSVRVLTSEDQAIPNISEIIADDIKKGQIPFICIANVHSAIFQDQDISGFEKCCNENNIWLHLEGHALAGLVLAQNEKKSLPTGDSMVLTLGSWSGIPAVPFITLYKSDGNTLEAAAAAGLSTINPAVRLNCLPLWCVLQFLGAKQLKQKIKNVFTLLETLNQNLSQRSSIRILSQRKKESGYITTNDLISGKFSPIHVYHTVSPALAFQYISQSPPETEKRVPPYFDNLNSWLGQIMQRDCSHIPLEIVDVETTGYVLRLCPFENLNISSSNFTEEDINKFLTILESQVTILDATVCQRQKFIHLLSDQRQLKYIELENWAGLGGVCYIPEKFLDKEDLNSNEKDMLNHRNIELVNKLRSIDSAFSLGESEDGFICIRFGMVSAETDVEELLNLVLKNGLELDENIEQLEKMTELVQKGIQQAQGELKQESEEQLWQEGILRHVPLVGSFYNWLSPIQKNNIKGRCMSLQEGKLAVSDEIIKTKKSEIHDKDESIPNKSVESHEEVKES